MKVYVINLDRRPDRLAEMTERLGRLGLDFERVSAFDGHRRSIFWKVSWWKAVIVNLLHLPASGQIAVFMSHRKAWADMIKKNIPQALIFEDDAEAVNWDSAIADISINAFHLDLLRIESIAPTSWIDYGFDGSSQIVMGRKAVNEMSYGAAAYVISLKGVKKCWSLKKYWFYVDSYDLWAKVIGLRTAVLLPVMFKQSGSASDIQVVEPEMSNRVYRVFDQLIMRPFVRALAKHARRKLIEIRSLKN